MKKTAYQRFKLAMAALAMVGFLGVFNLTGCEDDNSVEEATEEVADEVDDAF